MYKEKSTSFYGVQLIDLFYNYYTDSFIQPSSFFSLSYQTLNFVSTVISFNLFEHFFLKFMTTYFDSVSNQPY